MQCILGKSELDPRGIGFESRLGYQNVPKDVWCTRTCMADSIQLRARGEQKIGLCHVVAQDFLRFVAEPFFFFFVFVGD